MTPVLWSPNRIELDVKLRSPSVVIVNQNYESGWQVIAGPKTAGIGAWLAGQHHQWLRSSGIVGEVPTPPVGMLSVAMPAGNNRLILRHRPPRLAAGVVLTVLGIALAIAVLRLLTPVRIARWRAQLTARLSERS